MLAVAQGYPPLASCKRDLRAALEPRAEDADPGKLRRKGKGKGKGKGKQRRLAKRTAPGSAQLRRRRKVEEAQTPLEAALPPLEGRPQSASFGPLYVTTAKAQSYIQHKVDGAKRLLVSISAKASDRHQELIRQVAAFAAESGLTKEDVVAHRDSLVGRGL